MKSTMKKAMVCFLLVVLVGMLTGCSEKKQIKEGELTVSGVNDHTLLMKQDGSVQSAIVESFDKDYYDKDELASFLSKETEKYDSQKGADAVKVKEVGEKDGKAVAVFSYKDIAAYADFNETECVVYSMEDAQNEGILEGAFTNREGAETSLDEVKEPKDYQVLIFSGCAVVQTETPLEYVSGGDRLDDYSVKISGSGIVVYTK